MSEMVDSTTERAGRKFDSDTGALVERASINAARARHDLDAWIIEQAQPSAGMRILDLGCGTGKQLFALAAALSPDTAITGFDVSHEAIAAVNDRAREEGRPNVRAVQGSLDSCPACLDFGPFDLILSTYAIYYATDMAQLLEGLRSVLAPGGSLFVCGPGTGTNKEIVALLTRLSPKTPAASVKDFLDNAVIERLRLSYSSVTVSRLDNSIVFQSAEEVLAWWRNHNSFQPDIAAKMADAVREVFASQGQFELTKNVLAVRCHA